MRPSSSPRSFLPHLAKVKAATCFGRRITPPFVTLYVTTRCDERCIHCFYWDELNPKPNVDFTLAEFERTLASMGEIFNLFIGGGEPFLRADLAEIVLAAHRVNGVANVYVPTNGQHTERVVSTLSRVLPRATGLRFHLNLSVDHVDEDEHDRIRGRQGAYRRLLKTADAVKSLRQTHPNLILHTLTTVMRDNQSEILRIHEELKRRFEPDGTSYNYCRGNPLDAAQTEVDPQIYRELADRVQQDRRAGRIREGAFGALNHGLDEQVRCSVEKTVTEGRAQFSCVAGRLACVIYSNGDVTECETKNSLVGNLRDADYNFPSLWFSAKAESIAADAADGCHCTHECGHYASTIYSAKLLAKVAGRAMSAGSTALRREA
ncbi:MAG: radical SAM protein [Bryobacterales bacterium]|nr:radical SAM protein [Bryobacterales bacterium]MDE0261403.1 radical SAM protein [Bryobacterales bacterium]MDE0622325.1 radical SAM protein [Bryobacterales bacterium]